MAGTIKTNNLQLGDSATATQNFTLQTNVDGTAKLARGNAGATTQDILTIDAGGKVTATQSGPQFAKAWVNFDGTGTVGVNCTIRSSYNVTSVYKAGTGDYLITFTSALGDANYCVQYLTANDVTSAPIVGLDNATAQTTTQVRLASVNNSGTRTSSSRNCVVIFGN